MDKLPKRSQQIWGMEAKKLQSESLEKQKMNQKKKNLKKYYRL